MADRKAKVIAVVNQKGGVAKTTSVANLGAALVKKHKKVLLIDLDPQGSLSKYFDLYIFQLNIHDKKTGKTETKESTLPEKNTIYGVLQQKADLVDVILNVDGIDIAPANILMANADMSLAGAMGREYLLKEAVEKVVDRYDFILIDCPPSLGLLTINALVASDRVLVPILSEYMALEGTSQLLDTIGIIYKKFNPNLRISGFFLTRVDNRRALDKQVMEKVRNTYPNHTFRTYINTNVSLAEAPTEHKDIFQYSPKSKGASDYRALANELIERSK